MSLEGFDNRLGREPLVDEQGERGDVEAEAFGLARPIQEGPREPFELVHGILEGGDCRQGFAVGALELPHPLPLSRR